MPRIGVRSFDPPRRVRAMGAIATTLLAINASVASAQGSPPTGAPVLPTVSTKGGIRILEHSAGSIERARRLTVESRPVAVLGGADGDPDFDLTGARVAVLLPDHRIVTLAPVGNKLLVFHPDGRGQRSLGRTGKGPGELMSPDGMLRIGGDTVLVPDPANARFNYVTPDGGFVAFTPIRDPKALGPMMTPIGLLPGGEVVMYAAGLVQRGVIDSIVRPPTTVVAFNRHTGAVRQIAKLPDLELAMIETRYRGRKAMSTRPLRFGRRARAVVWDTLLATSSGDGYQIDVRAPTGEIRSRLRVPARRRPVTRTMRDAQIALELERLGGGGPERLVDASESQRLARESPFADSLPPFGQIFVTPDQTLWVVDAIAPGDTAWSATAFRRDGAVIGRLTVPGRSSPMAFGTDRVVVRTQDEDGLIALRVHRIVPAR